MALRKRLCSRLEPARSRIFSRLGIVDSALVFPRQLIKRRLIATSAITIFCHVEFLMLVIFHADTVLSAPAISFSVEAMRFHNCLSRPAPRSL